MSWILLVDDDTMCLDLLEQELTDLGYDVLLAASGAEALDLLRLHKVDLVLLDIMMPGMSGLEVLASIRQNRSIAELPVIMVTAKGHSEDIVQSLSLGANDYVTKPIDLPVLLARLRTQLNLRRLSNLKDEFLRIATHELNSPLMMIQMGASVLLDSVPKGAVMTDEMRDCAVKILDRATEMQQIISCFLDSHAIEDGKIKLDISPVGMNDLVTEVAEDFGRMAEAKEINLTVEPGEGLPQVPVDGARIKQVIGNLLSNAIKFCCERDSVTIRTAADSEGVLVEITDSGPGFGDSEIDRAFTNGGRLGNIPTAGERSYGLGLSICKRLISLHGGTIGTRNNPGGGATFWFRLPLGQG